MSIRGRIFVVSVALILGTLLATGAFLQHELHQWAEARVDHELLAYSRAARKMIEQGPVARLETEADRLADDLGDSFQARVTIISVDGRVLGDSDVEADRLATLENHGERPEVRAALAGGVGRAFRRSRTASAGMMYVAVPFERGDGRGVVRVALELSELETVASRLRYLFALAGVGAVLLAVALSFGVAHFMSKTLRTLVERARSVTADVAVGPGAVALGSGDEIEGLAGSLNTLAHELQLKVSTLARERDRFQSVLHGLSEAVIAIDGQLHITLMNDAALLLFGLSPETAGLPLIEKIRVPDVEAILLETLRSGVDQVSEFELPSEGDGAPRVVLARSTRLRASEGCVLVLHDVTEMRRLEAMRREFVANVSHELRTPVSVIRANAETLLDGALEDTARARQFLDALVRNADRLSRILADLLDLSRLEAGRYALDAQPVMIAGSVRRALELLEAKAESKSIVLASEVSEDIIGEADPRALEQVLLNLVDNAVKYTPARGRIVVRARKSGDFVRVEVSDDGPGIAPRHRARLFERFYRVDPGRSRDVGGTGLGLAIVKHLVESMGGRVGMEPANPHGSTFWFTLISSTRLEHPSAEHEVPARAASMTG